MWKPFISKIIREVNAHAKTAACLLVKTSQQKCFSTSFRPDGVTFVQAVSWLFHLFHEEISD